MRSHRVSRHHPSSLSELMREGKFVINSLDLVVKAKGNKRKTHAVFLAHDDEVELCERIGEVVGCAGEVSHDGAVSTLSETDELVVLTDDLRSAFGEIECEGCLVSAQVVDVED